MQISVEGTEAAEHHHHPDGEANAAPAPRVGREGDRAQARERAHHDDRAGPVEPAEQHDEQDAADGGTDEVRGVEPVDATGEPGEREADDDAAEHEGDRDHDARDGDRPETDERAVRGEGDGQLGDEADGERDAEEQRRPPEMPLDVGVAEPLRQEVDEQGAAP